MTEIQASFWVFSTTGKTVHTESKLFRNSSAAAGWLIQAHKDYPDSRITDKVEILGMPIGDNKARSLVRRVRMMMTAAT